MTPAPLAAACMLVAALASGARASAPAPVGTEELVRQLAALERIGVHLDRTSLAELQRDSRESRLAYELREKLRASGGAALEPLCRAAIACKRPKTLHLILDVLADLGQRTLPASLLATLKDPSTDLVLRRQYPRFLGRLGDPAQAPLLEALTRETDPHMARESVFALGALRERAGVPVLYRVLAEGSDIARGAAAETMGEIDEFGAVDALIARLLDKDPYVTTFSQTSLTELTYRCVLNRPLQVKEQHGDWAAWWAKRKHLKRAELLEECFQESLAALAGSDARKAYLHAAWLAELTFQAPPSEALFGSPLVAVAQQMEANRWREWLKTHAGRDRLEWFREAVDHAVGSVQTPDAPVAWPGLSVLSELIAHPVGDAYLFKAVWVREPLPERQRLARVYKEWWAANRSTFTPLGRKYW